PGEPQGRELTLDGLRVLRRLGRDVAELCREDECEGAHEPEGESQDEPDGCDARHATLERIDCGAQDEGDEHRERDRNDDVLPARENRHEERHREEILERVPDGGEPGDGWHVCPSPPPGVPRAAAHGDATGARTANGRARVGTLASPVQEMSSAPAPSHVVRSQRLFLTVSFTLATVSFTL